MQMDLAHKLHTSLPALVLIFARVSSLDGFSSGQNAIDDGPCLKVVLDRHELISVRKLRVRLEHCCLSSDCCAGYREKKYVRLSPWPQSEAERASLTQGPCVLSLDHWIGFFVPIGWSIKHHIITSQWASLWRQNYSPWPSFTRAKNKCVSLFSTL